MKKIAFGLMMLLLFNWQFAFADTESEHQSLRQLRVQITEALNTENFEQMKPLLATHFTLITVDNRKFTNLQDFQSYWQNLFHGEGALLKKIEVNPVADELTQLITPTVGVVSGKSTDTYSFNDGDVRKMDTLWTATLQKEGASWKIVTLHFSANIFNNPVLDAAKAHAYWSGLVGIIIGFILAVIVLYYRRRKQTT